MTKGEQQDGKNGRCGSRSGSPAFLHEKSYIVHLAPSNAPGYLGRGPIPLAVATHSRGSDRRFLVSRRRRGHVTMDRKCSKVFPPPKQNKSHVSFAVVFR